MATVVGPRRGAEIIDRIAGDDNCPAARSWTELENRTPTLVGRILNSKQALFTSTKKIAIRRSLIAIANTLKIIGHLCINLIHCFFNTLDVF